MTIFILVLRSTLQKTDSRAVLSKINYRTRDSSLNMAANKPGEHVERKSKTLFVRNLPFSVTNEKFEALFSEVGPVRTCFVVKDKG